MREIFLNLLGINEQWSKKIIIEPKLVISFHNLSIDGLTLLNNMLCAINLIIDNKQIQIKRTLPTNFLKREFDTQTLFLISDEINCKSSKKVFSCPHPNKIIKDSTLKSEGWKAMITLQKALEEVN